MHPPLPRDESARRSDSVPRAISSHMAEWSRVQSLAQLHLLPHFEKTCRYLRCRPFDSSYRPSRATMEMEQVGLVYSDVSYYISPVHNKPCYCCCSDDVIASSSHSTPIPSSQPRKQGRGRPGGLGFQRLGIEGESGE